ncbi:MAG: hypothetical protein JW751_12205, partial [Polyangiaceae bacterium]|nr:hypothetical protein [Polyangiaceae bacterium]
LGGSGGSLGGTGGIETGGAPIGGVASGGSLTGGIDSGGTTGGGDTGGDGGTSGGAGTGGDASGGASTGGTATTWATCSISDAELTSELSAWESAYVVDCTSDGRGKRVSGCGADTCSEAMGYGMLIAVNMERPDLFDDFWTFVQAHIPVSASGNDLAGRYLLPWSIGGCTGEASDFNNATDGDLDIAMALIQAEARWPGNGYLEGALLVIRDILAYNTDVYQDRRVLLAGDITRQPASNGNYPSYFAPGYYRVFAQALEASGAPDGGDLAGQYRELAADTYELFIRYQGAMTNKLWPEFAKLDGTINDQSYGYNACRTPWRIATDFAWFGTAEAATQLTTAAAVNPDPYAAASDKNSAFVGAFTFLHLPAGEAAFDAACDVWLSAELYDDRYFQQSLKLIYMLLAAGRFPSTL